MKSYVWPVLFSTLFSSPTYASPAVDEPKKAEMYGETGHYHDKSGKAHGADEHAVSGAGQPGKASRVARTIRMQALDTMRYAPEKLTVRSGQTVRFIVTDAGKLKHEFAIGDAEEQREHAEMMKEIPDMKHNEGNAVSLEPGQTKDSFGDSGNVATWR